MQLNFSIDAILGITDNTSPKDGEVSKKGKSSLPNPKSGNTLSEDGCLSPRSHTIEWKPPEGDVPHSPSPRKSLHKNDKGEKYQFQKSKSVLRSPPNARVVPPHDITKLQMENAMDTSYEKDSFISKMQSLKSFQKRLSATRFLPYSAESLESHGVHHHPHHYPYQLPYVGHGLNVESGPIPGIFSPHYSFQNGSGNSNAVETKSSTEELDGSSVGTNSRCLRPVPENGQNTSQTKTTSSCTFSEEKTLSNEKLDVEDDEAFEPHKSNAAGDDHEGDDKVSNQGRKKRIGRRLFTGFQILELEKAFAVKPYLNRMERAFISQKVNLTECQIKTWFQNRRTKEKRRGNGSEEEEARTTGVFRNSIVSYTVKPMRIPGYGIQLAPTYGPPDQHLQAAIVDYLRRRVSPELLTPNSN